MKKPLNCHTFKDLLVHFQADEIPEAQRREFHAHLDACADCARRLDVENGFLRALQNRLVREALPPGLETRVRAALRAEGQQRRSALGWLRRPWVAATAAAVILTVLLIPGIDDLRPQPPTAAAVRQVAREVIVVDLDCDRAGHTLEQQRGCRNRRHLNALRTDEGVYWNISQDHPASRDLLLDREMRGHRIRVEGDYFPAIHTVLLSHHQDLGLDSL